MSKPRTVCPRCFTRSGFEVVQDEIDIGVGVQTHITHGLCDRCGPIPYCDRCYQWDPPPHVSGCPEAQVTEQARLTADASGAA